MDATLEPKIFYSNLRLHRGWGTININEQTSMKIYFHFKVKVEGKFSINLTTLIAATQLVVSLMS